MNGIFDSNNPNTPAVSATGTNGAEGLRASSDRAGVGVRGVSTGAAGEQGPARGGTGVEGSAEYGGIGVFGRSYGVNEEHVAGVGVSGIAEGGGRGVYGWASGRDETDGSPACGVAGYSPEGVGVYGDSPSGFAMKAQGPTTQNRESGGWVKAMVHIVSPKKDQPSIARSFNSQPTNIAVYRPLNATGVLIIDFGFIVIDRFVTAIPESRSAYYAPYDQNDLSKGWYIQPLDEQGKDTNFITRSPSPPAALAMISFPGPRLVQVETFLFQAEARTGAVSYQRANSNVFVTVF